jgi:hypothetical protein
MGSTKRGRIGDLKVYRTVRLGDFAWKVFFKSVDGMRWKATITARRFFVITEPDPTGVRVTIQPLTLNLPKSFTINSPKFRKDWRKAGFPTDKGEALLLVALTAKAAKIAKVV